MPTYDYKCAACGHTFERFQSIKADPVKKCPVCGKNRVQRLIGTGAGLIFKGSGFYITDYRDAGYQEKAKADSGASSETKAETKTDGKSGGGGDSTAAPSTAPVEAKPAAAKGESTPAAPKAEPKPAASRSAKKK